MAGLRLTLPQALKRAIAAYQAGKLVEAEKICRQILSVQPDLFDALHLLGVVQATLGRNDLALASYDRALGLRPDHAEALYNRGVALRELNRHDEALASYDRALSLRPDHAEALYNRGVALSALNRHDEALASYDRALALRPDEANALNNRGSALKGLNRLDEALASYDRALSLRPDHANALYNRGVALSALNRHDEALASYDRALALRPDEANALNNRGSALKGLNRFDEALASFDRALSLQPDHTNALYNRGVTLLELGRHEEALASYDHALAVKPDHAYALSGAADCAIKLCDWDRRMRFEADLIAHVSGKKSIVPPFILLGYSEDPALQLQCTRNYLETKIPLPPRLFWTGQTWRHQRLRIAYLSNDFRSHPVAYLMAGLFEQHDRSRFDVIGVSFGIDDGSAIRKRLVAAFDEFHDVLRKSDQEIAKLLHDLRVDVAVDLMGHTRDSRPGILAFRPAPVQVSYLGFPATMGADFIDYIIADAMVLPFEQQQFYKERIVHLPDCYLVGDRQRKIAERVPARQEMGLPERGFVFCCFNNNWKITPALFDVWMRLLGAVPGSVLWLSETNNAAAQNLCREAGVRGIDASRLIFAPRLARLDEHLARHRLADLFLDTLPYNAHATASDALWAGLPVLTCKGTAFAGRVAASLLQAIGLPELIAANLEEYEALALKLARDPALMADIKAKLARQRETYPLFDTARFARHIESAYTNMWQIWQRGAAPKSFSVEPI